MRRLLRVVPLLLLAGAIVAVAASIAAVVVAWDTWEGKISAVGLFVVGVLFVIGLFVSEKTWLKWTGQKPAPRPAVRIQGGGNIGISDSTFEGYPNPIEVRDSQDVRLYRNIFRRWQ